MTELIEAVARGMRKKCAEIDNRPGVISPDAMWFSDEYAQAALTAIESAGYRIVKDEPVAWLYRREAHTSVVRTYPAIHDDMEGWTEIPCYAAPGDEK
jgi:hypothetical protein